MNTSNTTRETSKTQALIYLENKRNAVKRHVVNNAESVNSESSGTILLPVHKLKVTPTAQRVLTRMADEIAKNFNKNLFNPIIVSLRDGVYYVIDGQHRLYAAKKLFGDDYLMECKVIEGLSQQEESKLFVQLNSLSKPLQYADKAKGLFFSNDDTMVNLSEICKRNGVELGIYDDKRASADGRITAVKALVVTYNKIGKELTERCIRLINDTWDGASAAFRQEIIKAVAVILSLYSKELNDNKFIKKLAKVNPVELIKMARTDRVTNAKTEAKIARIMINNYYNKGKGATPLEYKFGF